MAKLTDAQRRNLIHVRDHGKALPRSPSGYYCRVKGLSKFVWLFGDGSTGVNIDLTTCDRKGGLVKVIGERLTPAGRSALEDKP